MSSFKRLKDIVATLRSPGGCPWDMAQTHESLKAPCIEEAAEVVCAVNIYSKTGDSDNLKEELGDLLLQVMLNAQIAEEEGLFTMDDIMDGLSDKLIRRHPHVFGDASADNEEEALANWAEIKAKEKAQKKLKEDEYLKDAFEESKALIDVAMKRKGYI